MKTITQAFLAAIVISFSPAALSGPLFPDMPVDMKPGYGSDGSGAHFARPMGVPGNDCVINPVSMTRGIRNETVVETIVTMKVGDIIEIPSFVLFDFDKSFVRPEGRDVVRERVYDKLVEFGVKEIEVIGHTDARGTEEYNYALGLRRATAVAEFLTDLGFPSENIEILSGGEEFPIAPNANEDGTDNPEGRQRNRRVEVVVKTMVEREVEENVEKEVVVVYDRNPQVFHRLSQGNRVICEGGYLPFGGWYGSYSHRYILGVN